ncbi:MAG: acetolactate decarboxylase [Planctomycetes bacterium]|nr:acetolactate decarboxylase [Planctomycetota bacterium]
MLILAGVDPDYSKLKSDKNTFGYFNVLRMDGTFDYLKLRSVPKQTKPYPTLAEAVKKQAVFEHRNIRGTLVGFRCPDSIGGLNVPGWHFHFISEDRKVGGHVLDIAGHDMAAAIIPAQEYQLILPDTDGFRRAATQPVEAGR